MKSVTSPFHLIHANPEFTFQSIMLKDPNQAEKQTAMLQLTLGR